MKFEELLAIVSEEPVFETGLLLAGRVDPGDVRRQLSRWTRAGKILQLRRGVYVLTRPYRKVEPHPFVLANRLVRASYVSLQAALDWHGHLLEGVTSVTSVTTGRPGRFETPLGTFLYRHVRTSFFQGFRQIEVVPGQAAFVASPEKALLDLCYLTARSDDATYLQGLRLQTLEDLDLAELCARAREAGRPKLMRFAKRIAGLAEAEAREYQDL